MIKIISFDIGNTLIENKSDSTIKTLEKILNRRKEDFIKEYKDCFQISTEEIGKCVGNFVDKINQKESYDEVMNHFLSNENDEFNIDVKKITVIQNLKNLGYKIIALSNSCKYKSSKQKKYLEEINLFDDIIYSYDVGACKPSREIFEFVQKKYNARPSEILHVGDSINSDYYAPIKVGWNAILYDPNNLISKNNINKITNFEDILSKIKG